MTPDDEIVGESPRLRRLCLGDVDEVASFVADPEQMRFYPRPKSRNDAAAWLAWNLALYEQHGFGTWYLESVPDGAFVGYCGLRPLLLDGQQEVELAWHVKKTHWNQGLATEAALTSMRLGFDRFGLSRLVAIIPPCNQASQRVAEKLGSRNRGPGKLPAPYADDPIDLWGQTRDEWLGRQPARARR